MTCDAWDTGLFVLGAAAARELARAKPEFAAVLIEPLATGGFTIWVEESLRPRFVAERGLEPVFSVRYF
jgi:hypothetical protein